MYITKVIVLVLLLSCSSVEMKDFSFRRNGFRACKVLLDLLCLLQVCLTIIGNEMLLQVFTCSNGKYLVDPASNDMLVSKIKPCMYMFTPSYGETANGSLNQPLFLRSYKSTWITVVILELIQ